MSCASRPALVALLAALTVAGCTGAPSGAPRPTSVEPAWAEPTAATPVLIRGESFVPSVTQDLGGAAGDQADAGFSAWLGGAALVDVRWVDARTLSATVPAGLPVGPKELVVEDAEGRRGSVAAAFLVGVPSVVLGQEGALSRALLSVGQEVVLTVTVRNDGNQPAAGVLPEVTASGAGRLSASSAPSARGLAPGASAAFEFRYTAAAAGPVELAVVTRVAGPLGGEVEAPALALPLRVEAPAALVAEVSVSRAMASVGQEVTVSVKVRNEGEAEALRVAPTAPSVAGDGALGALGGPSPVPPVSIPGGGSATFSWIGSAAARGSVTFTVGASGEDANSGAALEAAPAVSGALLVQLPPQLLATLSIPSAFAPGFFEATLSVRNAGEATAAGVRAAHLTVAAGSTASASQFVGFPGEADIPGGETRSFECLWLAGAGTLALDGSAAGTDANTGLPVSTGPVSSHLATVGAAPEVVLLEADTLGDGSPFAFVNGWQGLLLLGPTADGEHVVTRTPVDVTTVLDLALPKDTSSPGSTSRNGLAGAPPYPSLGSAACSAGRLSSCGPDLEDARGLLRVESWGGVPWILASGARTGGGLRYLHATPDAASPLALRYVDLTKAVLSQVQALTAARAIGARLYLGLGGADAQLLELDAQPPASGMDANTGSDTKDLGLDSMPRLGRSGSPANPASIVLVDVVEQFGGQLFVANNGGFIRSRSFPPGSDDDDWSDATPSASAWAARTSVTVTSAANLTPRDRAVPAAVAWEGRLFAIRNTTAGPQLWACSPLIGGDASACDPGDWQLYSPNTSGDPLLTQANHAGNARAGLLVATGAWLYLGLENAAGVQLYRTATATPVNISDFRGKGGCQAGAAGCEGLGGAGLGAPTFVTRFLDAKALSPGGAAGLYFTVGNGVDPARLYYVPD